LRDQISSLWTDLAAANEAADKNAAQADKVRREKEELETLRQDEEGYVQKLRDQISSLWTDLAAANEAKDDALSCLLLAEMNIGKLVELIEEIIRHYDSGSIPENNAHVRELRVAVSTLKTLQAEVSNKHKAQAEAARSSLSDSVLLQPSQGGEAYVQKLRDQISSLWTDLAAANEAADKNAAQADKVRREKEVLETLKEKLLSDLDKLGTEKEDTEKEKSQLASNVVTLLSELEESKLQADASKAELARVVAEAHENKLDQEEQLATLLKEECMKQILVIGGYKNFKRANSSCGNAVEAADHEQGEERSQDEPIFC